MSRISSMTTNSGRCRQTASILATPEHIRTFRLANALLPQVEVSGRFHLKPLLRAITFPHVAFVLTLSENNTRLIEVFADGAPVEVRVPDLPRDAASAAGRASVNDRSPSGRIQGSEGKKVRLAQFARKAPVKATDECPLLHPQGARGVTRSTSRPWRRTPPDPGRAQSGGERDQVYR